MKSEGGIHFDPVFRRFSCRRRTFGRRALARSRRMTTCLWRASRTSAQACQGQPLVLRCHQRWLQRKGKACPSAGTRENSDAVGTHQSLTTGAGAQLQTAESQQAARRGGGSGGSATRPVMQQETGCAHAFRVGVGRDGRSVKPSAQGMLDQIGPPLPWHFWANQPMTMDDSSSVFFAEAPVDFVSQQAAGFTFFATETGCSA